MARQAIEGADCGFNVSATVHGVSKKGFNAKVEVTNVSGETSRVFSVLVDAGDAELVHVAHGSFQTAEGGYLLAPLDSLENSLLDPGQTYTYELKFEGTYSELASFIMSSNGVSCDQRIPSIGLTANSRFFTSDGTLSLEADASDNVAVGKVVFTQDGAVIGTDRTAPYTLEIPVTSAINGRHRYEATAYDLAGNAAAESKRVLVAIDNKFFGTAAANAADYTDLLTYFNQITPGNAGKWGSVEAVRDEMNWTDLDTAYRFAKDHGLPFKLHTLIWGQQQPGWLSSLTPEEQLAEIDEWMAALADRYPDAEMIDVVNEPLHAPPSYSAALGGAGETGWDWVIRAFEMARVHFPNSELLLNEYYVLPLASLTTQYLQVVNVLNDRGLIDGIGEQGHFYERAEASVLASNLDAMAATGLPIYISELDLDIASDELQAVRMSEIFPIFWSHPSVVGVTHWGYRQGAMWQADAWLLGSDGTERASLTWLQCYMAGGTDCPVPVYVPEPRTGDEEGILLQAEEFDATQGLLSAGSVVAYADSGDWLRFDRVAFDGNWDTLEVAYANGGSTSTELTIHLGSVESAPVARVPLAPTGSWGTTDTVSIPWAPVSGEQNLFIRFGGGANLDSIEFSAPEDTGTNLIANGDFESSDVSGWSSWGGGKIAPTTARAVSGASSLAMTERTGNSPIVRNLSVVPGETYKLSLWATIGGAASADVNVTTSVQCADGSGPGFQWLGSAQTVTDGTWVEFSGDLAIPDCTLGWIAFWLEGPGQGVDLYLDHVSLRPVVETAVTNVVSNGTFESDASGWYTWNSGVLSATTARAHSGSQSLLVTNRANNAPAAIDLTNAVSPGQNYPVSLWVSIDSADGASQSINVTRMVECDGSPSYSWIAQATVPDGGQWVNLNGTLDVANCNVTAVRLWVEGGTADLYVDDVEVVAAAAASNLIPDGTFESGVGSWFGWNNASIAVIEGTAHSGSYSLVSANRTANGTLARDVTSLVTPGEIYQASFWVSVSDLPEGAGAVNVTRAVDCGSGAAYGWLGQETVNNGAWVNITGTLDLSACTSLTQVMLFAEGTNAGSLYVDDVTLTANP